MFSKFDANIQSDELSAADLYEAQAAWEADQADHEVEYEWTEEAIAWEEGMHPDNLYDDDPYDGEMWEDTYDDPIDLYGAEWDNHAVREWD